MVHQLVNSPEWARADTSSVESTSCGAAFLPPDLRVKYQSKLGPGFFHGYGLSESVRIPLFSLMVPGRLTHYQPRADPWGYWNDARKHHPWTQTGR